jgi:hypothetical protein
MKQPSSREVDAQVFNILDALQSPIITFTTLWADCIPKRILDVIPMARMKSLALQEELASIPEVAIYLITRSLESPMDTEWVNIYTWAGCMVCEEYFNEDHWKEVTYSKTLGSDEQRYLKDLRRFIYEKRRKALRDRLKSESSLQSLNSKQAIEELPKQPLKQLQLQFEF